MGFPTSRGTHRAVPGGSLDAPQSFGNCRLGVEKNKRALQGKRGNMGSWGRDIRWETKTWTDETEVESQWKKA